MTTTKVKREHTEGEALGRISEAVQTYTPSCVVALFSGGDDSLTATHLASRHPLFSFAAHLNTGIGIPETREFVHQTCDKYEWTLKEYRATEYVRGDGQPDPQVYERLVMEQGFPGSTEIGHRKMYNRLKERPLRMLVREHKRHRADKVLLITGCRSSESERRMGNVEPLQVDGARVWLSIIHDWTKADCLAYLERHRVERSPVVMKYGKSGECLCGAFAKQGELQHIANHYPHVAEHIRSLECRVKTAGFPWGWEERPPEWWLRLKRDAKKGQGHLFDLSDAHIGEMPLCKSCVFAEGET